MAANGYQAPSLQSILETLKRSHEQTQQSQQRAQHQYIPPPVPTPPIPQQHFQYPPHHRPQPPAAQPNVIDPATIIEWPPALVCVMKTVAKHDNILIEIRRLIQDQHTHEAQWYANRLALQEKQSARDAGRAKLDSILSSLGTKAAPIVPSTNANTVVKAPTDEEELAEFDRKVYRAQTQMVQNMSARLKALGVPFFGVKPNLIKKVNGISLPRQFDGAADEDKGKIDEVELVRLQRKMLETLVDLACGAGD